MNKDNLPVETINVFKCNIHGNILLEREVAQELRLAPMKALSVNLGLIDKGKFSEFLSTPEGETWLVVGLYKAFDRICKEWSDV